MKTLLAWLLWLWVAVLLWAAFFYSPLAAGFIGQSSRILFFHVPLAWTAFVARGTTAPPPPPSRWGSSSASSPR